MICVTCWRPCKKRRSRRRKGWEQLVFEFNKITGSAAAKPFTMPIFTSYPLLVVKRLERPRREGSCRKRSIKTSQRSCARPGRSSGSRGANFTAGGREALRIGLGKAAAVRQSRNAGTFLLN